MKQFFSKNIVATGAALLLGLAASRADEPEFDPPAPGTYALPVVQTAADGDVLDTEGRARRLREFTHGRITVMSFIYTRCAVAKACPHATGVLNHLHLDSAEDGALAEHLRLVSLSFDPVGDTPARMASFSSWAGERKPATEWAFLTTRSADELAPILEGYGQAVDRRANPLDPQGPLHHILRVFLIDREGRVRNIYSSGTLEPQLVLADVRTLLLEEKKTLAARADAEDARP